jgi:hypothetical protein
MDNNFHIFYDFFGFLILLLQVFKSLEPKLLYVYSIENILLLVIAMLCFAPIPMFWSQTDRI